MRPGPARTRRFGFAFRAAGALCCVSLLGCTSAEEKCAQAREAAADAWDAYAGAMETARDGKAARIKEIAVAMRGDIETRLKRLASEEASRLHDEGTSEWHRTYSARLQASCSADQECTRLRLESRTAEQAVASLDKRIEKARAAKQAVRDKPGEAEAALSAVEDDFEFDQVKQARALSAEAREACEGLAL